MASSTKSIRQPLGPRPSSQRVEAPVHLHQFPKVLPALAVAADAAAPSAPALHNPSPSIQRRNVSASTCSPSSAGQMLSRQGGTKTLPHLPAVLLPHSPQHLLAEGSQGRLGSSAARRSDASSPPRLLPDTASTDAWLAGSSPVTVPPRPRLAMSPLFTRANTSTFPNSPCSSLFAPI